MYCGKCGSQITDGATVCPVCGKPLGQAPARPEANHPENPKKPARQPRKPKRRKGPGILGWVALILVVATLAGLLGLAAVGRSSRLGGDAGVTLPGGAEVYTAEAWENEVPDLRLYLSDRIFLIGQDEELTITVKCSESVTEDVTVTDESGNEIAVLPNDGSGELKTTLSYGRPEESTGYMIAKSGEFDSAPEDFSVQPEVTEEMVDTLFDVSDDLKTFLKESDFEDGYSEEDFSQITNFLKNHEDVSEVQENNGVLLFTTKDNLVGSYGMKRSTEGYAGYIEPDEAFEQYRKGTIAVDSVVKSFIVPTNSKCLILTPHEDDSLDPVMRNHASHVNSFMKERFVDVSALANQQARESLASGDFTDCGLLFFNAHGKVIRRDPPDKAADSEVDYDGSNMVFMDIGETKNREEAKDYINGVKDGYQMFYTSNITQSPSNHATIDYTYIRTGEKTNTWTICITSRFLETVLEGKQFDNTVVYLFVCYAFSDPQLRSLLFDHGASMIIGCEGSFKQGYSEMIVCEMWKGLDKEKEDGSYHTYLECIKNVSEATIWDIVSCFAEGNGYGQRDIDVFRKNPKIEVLESTSEPSLIDNLDQVTQNGRVMEVARIYNSYLTAYNLAKELDELVAYQFHEPQDLYQDRVLHGTGSVCGKVMMPDGKPIADAKVKAYQWMDHTYTEAKVTATTDDKGQYTFSELPYGIYVFEAELDGRKENVSIELNQLENEAEDIVIGDNIVLTSTVTSKKTTDPESTGYGYDKIVIIPRVLEVPSDGLENALKDLTKNAEKVAEKFDYASYQMMRLDQIHCNGNVLSLTYASRIYSGGAHPFGSVEHINFDIGTGKDVSLPDILSDSRHYPNLEGAWGKLVDECGSYFAQYKGEMVAAAMAGEDEEWAFTPDGLALYLTSPGERVYAEGQKNNVYPYDILNGELAERYIPVQKENNPAKCKLTPISGREAESAAKDRIVWGEETKQAVTVDGIASNFRVCICIPGHEDEPSGIVFYARYLKDAMVWLPEWEDGLYKITWYEGDRQVSTMVQCRQ